MPLRTLSSLGVIARLTLAVGVLLAVLAANAGLNLWQQSQTATMMAGLAAQSDKLRLVDRWAALSESASVRIMAVNKSGDEAISALFGPEIGPKVKEVGELFRQIKGLATRPEELAWFEQMTPKREALLQSLKDMAEYRKIGDMPAASTMFDTAFMPAQKAYNEHIQGFVRMQRDYLEREAAETAARGRQQALLALGVVGLLAVGGGVLAATVLRHIRRSLGEAVAVAQAVAAGDLSHPVTVRGRDEFGTLMRALAEMTGSLERIVGQVRQGTDSIATASAEIAQGNNDLSQRTEQQAGNVQAAASAMDQITVSVRQNAEHARQANALAQAASEVAQRGGEAVARVVDTMGQINTASRRIEEIIGVIDGISFQTNILALNAAVEAARAGEQGRGFAVVAGEVRSLAQRSANAAKEIKDLIADSTDKVRVGSEQVEGAGRTMDEIVDSVRRVSTLVSEITQATAEQDSGIASVGQSVSEIDQMTQQNAALVEQAAAAAESMRRQAQELEQAVAVFRVGR
ncbi:HAMP domain-containing protein [Ideonella sp. 4Y11]|uniref:HAMP domain-containing protein n=1 Tax=Ideonella aquatica TaxID=2824119 RepID=A0A941BF56_9BURK|nr:HAMP domain-containing protein [Ideonella aquatica]